MNKFLRHPAAYAALTAVAATMLTAPAMAQSEGMSHLGIPTDRVGVVGHTFREQIGTDPRGTLQAVADCGIENIEFSGSVEALQGVAPAELKVLVDEIGLNVPSIGVSEADLRERLDQVIETAKLMGASYLRTQNIGPHDPEPWTAERYAGLAMLLNEAGAALKAEGITLAYHNHNWEFDDLGEGTSAYQLLLTETDPEAVAFELDLYWVTVVEVDPTQLFEENPGRFPLLHVKDLQWATVDGAEAPTFATVGEGVIDFAEIFAHSEEAGTEWFLIENDRPQPDGVTATCESLAYMTSAEPPAQ